MRKFFIHISLILFSTINSYAQSPSIDNIWVAGSNVTNDSYTVVELENLNESFRFTMGASNGCCGNAPAGYSWMTISVREFTSNSDKQNIDLNTGSGDDLESSYGEYFGSESGGDGYAEFVVVEVSDTDGWNISESNQFSVNIIPKTTGIMRVYYRLGMSTSESIDEGDIRRVPDSGTRDATGFFAKYIDIDIKVVGDLGVVVNNVPGINSNIPGSNGTVELYDQDANEYLDSDGTNSSGAASFSGLDASRTYYIDVYHDPDGETEFADEYWGTKRDIEITANTNNQEEFTRNMPYSRYVKVYDPQSGNEITGQTILPGTEIEVRVTMYNPPNGVTRNVRGQVLFDRDKEGDRDVDETIGSASTVSAGSEVTQSFSYTPTEEGSYYAAVGVLTDVSGNYLTTDGSGWYTDPSFVVETPTGDLGVVVNNVPGINSNIPGSNGTVELYDQDANEYLDSDGTNSSGAASFSGLDASRTYYIDVYHDPDGETEFADEYWGTKRDIEITANTNNQEEFTRNMPYSRYVKVYDPQSGNEITGQTILPGTEIEVRVTMYNPPNGVTRNVRGQVLFDRDKEGDRDVDETIGSASTVSAGSEVTQSFSYTPTEEGSYYAAVGVLTDVSGNYLTTDGSGWYTDPSFVVETPTGDLGVVVNNVPGINSNIPGSNGTVELYDQDANEYLDSDGTNSSGAASFSGLDASRTYYIDVYHDPDGETEFADEYWGTKRDIEITANTNNQEEFTRNMPYSRYVKVYDPQSGNEITGQTILPGTEIEVRVTMYNPPNGVTRNVRGQVLFDRDKEGDRDVDETIGSASTVSAGSEVTQSFSYTPTEEGSYYAAVGVLTDVSGNYLTTDGSGWYTDPSFIVQPIDSDPPHVDASTIVWDKQTFYPNKVYEITAEYSDPDGRQDIKYARIQLNHPNGFDDSPTIQWVRETGDVYAWDLDNGETYIDYANVSNVEEVGDNGFKITWQLVLKPNWYDTENGIRVGIQAEDISGTYTDWSYQETSVGFQEPEYGVTIISHGLNPDPDDDNNQLRNMTPIGEAILHKVGKGRLLYYEKESGNFGLRPDLTDYVNTEGGETVLIFDWNRESNDNVKGYSEAAADALFAALKQSENRSIFELTNLHLIGHSRGTVITSEVVQRLLFYGHEVDQVTYLDAHDWGLGWEGFAISDDHDVNPIISNSNIEISFPPGTIPNTGVIAWKNNSNIYFESYWQDNGKSDPRGPFGRNPIDDIPDGCTGYNLNGRPIQGASNIDWTDKFFMDEDGDLCPMNHGGVVDHYVETILNPELYYGYKNTRLFSGKSLREDSIEEDKIENKYNATYQGIVNGDFKRNLDLGSIFAKKLGDYSGIPGYSEHGGSEFGNVDELTAYTRNEKLILDYLDEYNLPRRKLIHNRFYIPPNAEKIRFDYENQSIVALENVQLNIFVANQTEVVVPIIANDIGYYEFDISSHQNTVITFGFELEAEETVLAEFINPTAKVEIDNIQLVLSQGDLNTIPLEPIAELPLQNQVLFNLDPTFTWTQFEHGGDNNTRVGYQFRVRSDTDNDRIVYDTGLIEDASSTTHLYSPGSFNGTDSQGQERISDPLEWGKLYHWHVRYLDNSGDWSPWSSDAEGDYQWFTTREPIEPIIAVKRPNIKNQVWNVGETQSIEWDVFDVTGELVINLIKESTLVKEIANIQEGISEYAWTIPSDLSTGSDYKIEIVSVNDPSVVDESDYTFIIFNEGDLPDPSVTVSSPNGGEQWNIGQEYKIEWDATNIDGDAKITLLKNGSVVSTIATLDIDLEEFNWLISEDVEVGLNYTISIASLEDNTVTDVSDETFEILMPMYQVQITINPEQGGEVTGRGEYSLGETVTLTANPSDGYDFINWSENNEEVSTDNPFEFTIDQEKSIVANFEYIQVESDSIPTILNPTQNAAEVSLQFSFVWSSVVNAVSYDMHVSGGSDFSSEVLHIENYSDTTKQAENLIQGEQYYWRVRANFENMVGEWSDTFRFTTKPDDILPIVVSISDSLEGFVGDEINIPVRVENPSSQNFESFGFSLTYDSNQMEIYGVDTAGTMSSGFFIESNLNRVGEILVNGAFDNEISGSGVLLNLQASLNEVGNSELTFSEFNFNEGNPFSTTSNGAIEIISNIICGDVTENGTITNEDATFILRHVVELDELVEEDSVRADVTGNGWISSYDASQVLRNVVGKEHLFNCGSVAKLVYKPISAFADWYIMDTEKDILEVPVSIQSSDEFEAVDIKVAIPSGLRFKGMEETPENWMISSNTNEQSVHISLIGLAEPESNEIGVLLFEKLDTNIGGTIQSKVRVNDNAFQELSSLTISEKPSSYSLSQNYPNPFNPSTNISYSIPEQANVQLVIYNMLGQKVAELVNETKEAGTYSVVWEAGESSSGMYVYQLKTGSYTITKSMMLIK